jgi:IS5 family transposase
LGGTLGGAESRRSMQTRQWRKRGNQKQEALGRSRGGFSTKIHLRTNAKGDPLTFDVTGGEVHETQGFDALMALHDARPAKLRGDKGYDSDEIRDDLAKSQY